MRRIAAIIIILISTAGALLAADDSPRFLIERIDVRNTRHASPAIIRAEARLTTGQTYSEADLREASYRVARLPFVLDAQYSLEKGSKRDAYVFVILVTEIKPLFYEADISPYFERSSPGGFHEVGGTTQLLLGGRMFAGSRGVFHAAVGAVHQMGSGPGPSHYRLMEVGYTHYDLFGSRAFATIDLASNALNPDTNSSPSLTLALGVPLSGNQTLTLNGGHTYSGGWRTGPDGQRHKLTFTQNDGAVSWSYNTTNSPFFPTRGEIFTVAAERYTSNLPAYSWDITNGYRLLHSSLAGNALTFSGEKHWELSDRDSLSAMGQVQVARNSTSYDTPTDFSRASYSYRTDNEVLTLGYSHSLFDGKTTRARGDSRLDVSAGIRRMSSTYQSDLPRFGSHNYPVVSATWSRRTSWGLLRLGATYGW